MKLDLAGAESGIMPYLSAEFAMREPSELETVKAVL